MINRIPKILLLLGLFFLSATAQVTPKFICGNDKPQTERDFKDWRRGSIEWIITRAEDQAFSKLKSETDRTRFIEEFWQIRDPNPKTVENELKVEYCKRGLESTQFQSGIPGWKTDRGRTFLIFGKPNHIERGRANFASLTNVLFEKWTYEKIEGVAQHIEIVFIDPTETLEYRFSSSNTDLVNKIFASVNQTTFIE